MLESPGVFPSDLSRMALHSEECTAKNNWRSRIHSDAVFKTTCCKYSDAIKYLISKFGVLESITTRDQMGFSLIHYIAAGPAFGLSDDEDIELLCVWLRSLWDTEVAKPSSCLNLKLDFQQYEEQMNTWSLRSTYQLSLNDLNTGPPPHPLSLLLSSSPSRARSPPVALQSSDCTIDDYLASVSSEQSQNIFYQVADSLKNLPPLAIAISCNSITSIRAITLHLSASPFLVSSPSSTTKEYYRTPIMCGIRLNAAEAIQAALSAFLDRWEDRLNMDGYCVRKSTNDYETPQQLTERSMLILQPGNTIKRIYFICLT